MVIDTVNGFKNLSLGSKVYSVTNGKINTFYYAGISPVSNDHMMCISRGNVADMFTIYLPNIFKYKDNAGAGTVYSDDYDEAKEIMLDQLYRKMESIKDIYFKDWNEQDWRDYHIRRVLKNENQEA